MKHGRPRQHTDQKILDALRRFVERHGRAPYRREMRGMRYDAPSRPLLEQRFGSVAAAFRLVDASPNPEGGLIRHGRCLRRALALIDPEKAEAVTRAKRDYWSQVQNGKHGLAGWTHPYARKTA